MSDVKGMIDGVVAGDLNAATAAFNAALDAKRTAEWEGARLTYVLSLVFATRL